MGSQALEEQFKPEKADDWISERTVCPQTTECGKNMSLHDKRQLINSTSDQL